MWSIPGFLVFSAYLYSYPLYLLPCRLYNNKFKRTSLVDHQSLFLRSPLTANNTTITRCLVVRLVGKQIVKDIKRPFEVKIIRTFQSQHSPPFKSICILFSFVIFPRFMFKGSPSFAWPPHGYQKKLIFTQRVVQISDPFTVLCLTSSPNPGLLRWIKASECVALLCYRPRTSGSGGYGD